MTLLEIHGWAMFICFIVTIGFGVSALDEEFNDNNEKSDKYYILSLMFCVLLVGLFIFFMIGLDKCEKTPWIREKEPYVVEHIVGLADNNLTNGRFYMRRGYIEDKLYYQYMVELGNGGFIANKVNSADATLFYDTSNYRVEWYKKTRSWLYFRDEKICHKIYIPEGSITDDYMIDLNWVDVKRKEKRKGLKKFSKSVFLIVDIKNNNRIEKGERRYVYITNRL